MATSSRKMTAVPSSRKLTAVPSSPSRTSNGTTTSNGNAPSVLSGVLVKGASLGTVQGRGRKPIAPDPELITLLEATRRGEGVGEFPPAGVPDPDGTVTSNGGIPVLKGTDQEAVDRRASEVSRYIARIKRWCEMETEAGHPTTPDFRTLLKDDKPQGRQLRIRFVARNDVPVEVTK